VTARRNAGTAPRATPNETGAVSRTKSERARTRTSLSGSGVKKSTPLRDSSSFVSQVRAIASEPLQGHRGMCEGRRS
jgi:hypothetical protein